MKSKINFVVDILMFFVGAALTGIGFLMKYTLIPGKDRLSKFGRQVDLYYLNLDRHEWGAIHLILGFVMVGLLLLHIILHWKLIKSMFRNLIGNTQWRSILTIVFTLICLFLLIFPFVVGIDIHEIGPGQGHHSSSGIEPIGQSGRQDAEIMSPVEPVEHPESHASRSRRHLRNSDAHEHLESDIQVRGYMSLEQVSKLYQVPVDSLLSGLGIDHTVSRNEQLGQLRKRYGFRINDVERIVLNHREMNK